MSDELPDYVSMERALGRAKVDFSGAEIHGMGCGMLVVDQAVSQEIWLAQVLEGSPQDFHVQEARTLLRELFIATRQQLNDPGMAFELFLPEDDSLGNAGGGDAGLVSRLQFRSGTCWGQGYAQAARRFPRMGGRCGAHR